MIATLIRKDLARLRVNWRGLLVLLAMPLCITGIVGTVFGPAARNGELPRIKLAIVNEDENVVGEMLSGIISGDESQKYLEPVITDRAEAMRLINRNKISAVIIVPANFSSKFLLGETAPAFELIKNPAQSYMPAISEELFRVVTELLNAISQNLLSDAPELIEILEDTGAPDVQKITKLVVRVGRRFERAEDYLFPPIIGFHRGQIENNDNAGDSTYDINVFAFVMPGLVAVFLLFTAEGTTRDLFAEKRKRTLDRFRTLTVRLLPFLLAKSVYSIIVVLISATIMLVGGSLIFAVTWKHLLAVSCLTVSYSVFSTGFAYLLVAIIFREQLAGILNTVIIMLIGFLGGSMMPSESLPPFIRDTVSAWMPNYIFAEAIKSLQFDREGPHWITASTELFVVGALMLVIATYVFQKRLLSGKS